MRYGDDFILIADTMEEARRLRKESIGFLRNALHLEINCKHDTILPVRKGLKFLGVELFSSGRRLNRRGRQRAASRLDMTNLGSYDGLVRAHTNAKGGKRWEWFILERMLYGNRTDAHDDD